MGRRDPYARLTRLEMIAVVTDECHEVEPHRIVLTGLPRMLRELIVELLDPDARWRVVAVVQPSAKLADEIDRWKPDVLIAGDGAGHDQALATLLYRRPRMLVLAIDHDARCATLLQLVPRRQPLGELRRASLAAVLDAALASAPNFEDPS